MKIYYDFNKKHVLCSPLATVIQKVGVCALLQVLLLLTSTGVTILQTKNIVYYNVHKLEQLMSVFVISFKIRLMVGRGFLFILLVDWTLCIHRDTP